MESAIYAALVALLDEEQATPRDISRLFLDGLSPRVQRVKDPVAWNTGTTVRCLAKGCRSKPASRCSTHPVLSQRGG
jgi:hypothetical protein